MGCVGYHRQYTECQQPDLVRLQTLHPQDHVLVRKSVVLEETTLRGIHAIQGRGHQEGQAEAVLTEVVRRKQTRSY
jgi:hypothetical protein